MRGFVPERFERVARGAVAQLRLVAEREKRLGATSGRPGARDRKDFVRGEIGALARARPLGERAIVADVPAKMGERNEHLARIGDMAAVPLIAQTARGVDQLRERRLFKPDRSASSLESPIAITFEAIRHASVSSWTRAANDVVSLRWMQPIGEGDIAGSPVTTAQQARGLAPI